MRLLFSALALAALDQIAKLWAINWLKPRGSVEVIPLWFSFTYVENRGAAWGIMAEKQLFLITFSAITLVLLFLNRQRIFGPLRYGSLSATLLLGGIAGNLIDRMRLSYVVDYLDFYWGSAHFPAFNIADAAICCGVFLMLLTQWLHDRGKSSPNS